MLLIKSAELDQAAAELRKVSSQQEEVLNLREVRWKSFFKAGNEAVFLDASFSHEADVAQRQRMVATQMTQVAAVLAQTAATVRTIETDLISMADKATQDSSAYSSLLAELQTIGQAIDQACAAEIKLLCTEQASTTTSLSEVAEFSLDEIHELVLATAPEEVRSLAAQYPDARLLPSSDGVILTFGNIETAPSVTTVVPGVGSASPTSWSEYAARTQRLAGGGAGILWLDYRAPSNIAVAAATHAAATGGGRLQDFQAELRRRAARLGNEPQLTVVAHSYGSVVAGQAAKSPGLNADALVVMGSPGVGASHASELDLRGDDPQVIAVTSPTDPIGLAVGSTSGVHGPDPADPRFGAEVWPGVGGHSDYWSDAELVARLNSLRTGR